MDWPRFDRISATGTLTGTVQERYLFYTVLKMNNNVIIHRKNIESLGGKDSKRKRMSMDRLHGHPRSHLFTVRVWEEEIGIEQTEWRGKVQSLTTGEVRYFREWAALTPLLLAILSELDSDLQANQ